MQRNKTQYRYNKFGITLFSVFIWTTLSLTFAKVRFDLKNGNFTKKSPISNLIRDFIQPFIHSLHPSDNSSLILRLIRESESKVTKTIRKTVEKLKPFLQDEEEDNKAKEPDGKDETTIIEFLPKPDAPQEWNEPNSELQRNIHKYENIKSEIKQALEIDNVTETTMLLITRTLDDLIAQVIGNQCTWKSVDFAPAIFRNRKDVNHNITVQEWDDVNNQYLSFLQFKQMNKSIEVLNKFHKLFSEVINYTQSIANNYKFSCQLFKVKDDKAKDADLNKNIPCGNDFKTCSQELYEFLLDFYTSLNDTAVNVFRNFAAMYVKDVIEGDDSQDTDSVPNILENIGNAVDRRVSNDFIQETIKLKLDEKKNKKANIKILRDFIKQVVKNVLKHIKKHLDTDLVSLKTKLFLAVKKDITINLNVDLGNLETHFLSKICSVFVQCNGKISKTRRATSDLRQELNHHSMYVKLQQNFDDRIKDGILRANRKQFKYINKNKRINDEIEKYRRFYSDVTRTTVGASTTDNNHIGVLEEQTQIKNSILEIF